MNINDIRDIYPDYTDDALQATLDEALAWVAHFAPCYSVLGFPKAKADLVRSLVKRALRYDQKSQEGTVQNQNAGPYGVTIDTRRPVSSTLFSPEQVAILKGLCSTYSVPNVYSVPLSPPQRPY